MKDLFSYVCDGSMLAVALIAADRGVTIDAEKVRRALVIVIQNGWQVAAKDALEACQLSEEMGRTSLNLSCNLFAAQALDDAGYPREVAK